MTDYTKVNNRNKAKLCYTDIDSFIRHIKSEDVYANPAEDVETRFDTSNYEVARHLPTGKNNELVRLMENYLGGIMMRVFFLLKPKGVYLFDRSWLYWQKGKGCKEVLSKTGN